jgi:isopenicillin N synthase-like dioxygenase
MTTTIPVISLEGLLAGDEEETRQAAAELRSALERVGFFYVVSHGIDWDLVKDTYDEAARFFALPATQKMDLQIRGGKRGYMPIRGETSYSSTVDSSRQRRPNVVESLFVDKEETGRNQWPDLPGFAPRILQYFDAVERLAIAMLPLYARALDLVPGYFTGSFERPVVGLRLSHYPAPEQGASSDDSRGEWGISAHTDRSFMTLLPTNDVLGLWIRPEGMDWIEAPKIEESFLVNSGDTLRRWSNDRLLSTAHRVARPTRERYALPFFLGPALDTVIEPLETCVDEAVPAAYEPITYEDFERQFLTANYGTAELLS